MQQIAGVTYFDCATNASTMTKINREGKTVPLTTLEKVAALFIFPDLILPCASQLSNASQPETNHATNNHHPPIESAAHVDPMDGIDFGEIVFIPHSQNANPKAETLHDKYRSAVLRIGSHCENGSQEEKETIAAVEDQCLKQLEAIMDIATGVDPTIEWKVMIEQYLLRLVKLSSDVQSVSLCDAPFESMEFTIKTKDGKIERVDVGDDKLRRLVRIFGILIFPRSFSNCYYHDTLINGQEMFIEEYKHLEETLDRDQ